MALDKGTFVYDENQLIAEQKAAANTINAFLGKLVHASFVMVNDILGERTEVQIEVKNGDKLDQFQQEALRLKLNDLTGAQPSTYSQTTTSGKNHKDTVVLVFGRSDEHDSLDAGLGLENKSLFSAGEVGLDIESVVSKIRNNADAIKEEIKSVVPPSLSLTEKAAEGLRSLLGLSDNKQQENLKG